MTHRRDYRADKALRLPPEVALWKNQTGEYASDDQASRSVSRLRDDQHTPTERR